ncbi:hypothetical protein EDC04DRAFT_2922390, partial [Pisolithus marmoratus]
RKAHAQAIVPSTWLTQGNRGLDSTSIGIVVCARHGMKLANGIRDLQKGERYVNMDYLFALALSGTAVNRLNVSYDITYLSAKHVSFFVPKFHLPTHITPCQWKYSFNWMHGVGHTNGEVPECGWAHINPVGSSTKVMGPGHCHDTIDDFFGDWNWKKTIALGPTIHQKISEAILQWNEHREDFEELEASLSIKYPEQLSMWWQQVEDWEDDPSKPNPFEEEAWASQSSLEPPLHPDILPSILISASVDLEDQQWHLQSNLTKLGMHATDAQKAKMQQCSNALTHHIEVWTKIHTLYVPAKAVGGLVLLKIFHYSSVAKYHAVHHALSDDDIHSMSGEDDQASEGRWWLSWIWLACGYMTENVDDKSDCGLQEAIQIEWCKARARAHHWAEELDLLLEEKQRTLQFLKWDATHWAERAEVVTGQDKSLDEGLRAYAEHQADICRKLGVSFAHTWCDTEELSDIVHG